LSENPDDFAICLLAKESQSLMYCYVAEATPAITNAATNATTPSTSYMTTGSYFSDTYSSNTYMSPELCWLGSTSKV